MSPELNPAVTVEVLLLSTHAGCLRFRQVSAALRREAHPDDVVMGVRGRP